MYTFLLLLRRVHIRECVPLWCEDFEEFRSDSGITGFAVAPEYRVGVSGPLWGTEFHYYCTKNFFCSKLLGPIYEKHKLKDVYICSKYIGRFRSN
jgi:hypothetical protein